MKQIFLIVILGLSFQSGLSQKIIENDFQTYFDKYGVEGCFVLFNQLDDELIKYNSNLCDSGYIPASTFKIPHSLIAIEEKAIKDTTEVIKWDGHEWPHKTWNQDQTLKTAMRYSCIWVYFSFAEQIGIDKYYKYVNEFNYGNKDLTGPPTRFWLAGLFKISANEQVDFLKRFYNYDLPVSRNSIDIVKDLIVLEQNDFYTLSGKTGSGRLTDNEYIMWLVGYVERNNQPYFYAMNFKTDNLEKTQQARYEITKDILKELKLIE
ncbi:penicillin-binding transpeptidase domain-containing protein [Marinilabilia sp.]|uniref:penicillin-binding transpeptidase domain-containing protein n=1 Tax=Marinilabilia sp. TaxID=2021252 RepID=UPI0025BBEE6E|nr:penicillin-binding transpeptidase domain-containing protein [Marinilabilia sp.]